MNDATYLVRYNDTSGDCWIQTHAYVDATSEAEAIALVRSWGVEAVSVRYLATETIEPWERAAARRFYMYGEV